MIGEEYRQIAESTDAQLQDRLAALEERFDPKRDGGCFPAGGYPLEQLRELHLIQAELAGRLNDRMDDGWTDADWAASENWVADNHVALDRETDVERYR